MAQKYSPRPPKNSSGRLRPGQDIVVRKQAQHFPDVGVTLTSYNHQSAATGDSVFRSEAPTKKPGRLKRIWKGITLKRTALACALLLLIVGGWLGYKFVYNAHRVFGGNVLGILHTTKLKGEDTGRVNILLAGNSADDAGHDGAELTDSIMIMSIDTKNNTAYLLSVPRDLWVNVGDSGYQKINQAYVTGEDQNFSESGYPDGGMGQLEQVIHDNLGIDINYYALIDYTALKDAVNDVGGIDVTIKSSDPRGLYDPSIDYATHGPLVKLTNGTHHLNGEQALDLARARGDAYGSYGFAGSDFERTQNQRMMLVALKSKVVSAGVISNPAKLSSLSDAIGTNVKTDFKINEVRRLYDLTKNISGNNIQSLSLNSANGKNLLASYTSPSGQSALIPAAGIDDYSDIQAYIAQQSSTNPVVREGATVVVLNATNTSGTASKQRTALEAKHINVGAIGDATTTQATTTIIDLSDGKMSATRQLLQQIYGNHFTTTNPYANIYNADFIILVGSDQVKTTSTTSSTTTSD